MSPGETIEEISSSDEAVNTEDLTDDVPSVISEEQRTRKEKTFSRLLPQTNKRMEGGAMGNNASDLSGLQRWLNGYDSHCSSSAGSAASQRSLKVKAIAGGTFWLATVDSLPQRC